HRGMGRRGARRRGAAQAAPAVRHGRPDHAGRPRGARAPSRDDSRLPGRRRGGRARARPRPRAPARVSASVIAIFGPTASGKSAVAEELAARIPAELVSADSMQVYRGLPILTNQSAHPTRLVGIWELDHEASVGEYQHLAHAAIDEILAEG